jgi:hypothetical protein
VVARTLEVPKASLENINYDSFDEAIRDLNWLEFSNILVVMIGCCTQRACNYAAMSAVLEICADAARPREGFFAALEPVPKRLRNKIVADRLGWEAAI